MISSAMASGSENSFGMKCGPRRAIGTAGDPRIGRSRKAAIAHLQLIFVCDEVATDGRNSWIICSPGLPVAAAPSKQALHAVERDEKQPHSHHGPVLARAH